NAFKPSEAFEKPHAILCVSAIVAPTDEEAEFLSGSQALNWALFHSGQFGRLVSPEVAAAHAYTPGETAIIENQRPLWIIGSPERVADVIATKAQESDADEVMVTTTIWDYALRQRSYRLLAEAMGVSA